MTKVAKAIVFSYPLEQDRTVPIAEAFAFHDREEKDWHASRVIWTDGTSSFAKGWWKLNAERTRYLLCQIGAGASGNMLLCERVIP